MDELPVEMRSESLVPSREKLEEALKLHHDDGVTLRRLLKLRDELDALAGRRPPREKRKAAGKEKEAEVA